MVTKTASKQERKTVLRTFSKLSKQETTSYGLFHFSFMLLFRFRSERHVSTIFGFTGISLMFPVITRQPCFQELTKYLLNIQSLRTAEVEKCH